MELEIGAILTGKITGITKFGAFVELAPGKSGLVYISEISDSYVKDVNDYLTMGQEVTVKIISIDDAGRINLSIKQAAPKVKPQAERVPAGRPVYSRSTPPPVVSSLEEQPADTSFEDKLKRFMKDADSKMSDIKRHTDRYNSSRRKRK